MTVSELIAEASRWIEDQQPQIAIRLYTQWLQENPESPHGYLACFNLGVIYADAGQYKAAIKAYQTALEAGCIEAGINLGLLLEQQGSKQEAIGLWQTLLEIFKPDDASLQSQYCLILNNLGRIFEDMDRLTEAESFFSRSLDLQPDQPAIWHHRLYLRQKLCLWPVTENPEDMARLVAQNNAQIQGFQALISDFDRQSAVWAQWLQLHFKPDTQIMYDGHLYAHDRIRLGYLTTQAGSGNLGSKWASLFEHHDRKRYELYFFDYAGTNPEGIPVTQDTPFISLNGQTDREIASTLNSLEIDILIDLDGCQQSILDYRPSPVQIVMPGLGCFADHESVDYVLADSYTWQEMPDEKRLPLPPGGYGVPLYNPADGLNLPDGDIQRNAKCASSAVVFVYQGESYRITEALFSVWMAILQRVPDSVLWLAVTPDTAHAPLQAAANRYGIVGQRLVFTDRLDNRLLCQADIFLDTYPANTACHDALQLGIPVLTCAGDAPASRLTGSILMALSLPELIVSSQDEYLHSAIQLGQDKQRLAIVKAYLKTRLHSTPVFDPKRWVSLLESLYEQVWAREMTGISTANLSMDSAPRIEPKPFFSVIVVHYEGSVSRAEAIRCLQSLYHQKYHNFEILLLHDGPRSLPWETDEFSPPSEIRIKTHSTMERANDYGHSLRDLGIRMARGQYILITNADNYHYTNMLLELYREIIRPYPKVMIDGVNRTAADIIIFGIMAKGYMSLGTHENLIDFREFNMQMARQQWMYLSGYPSIVKNIDCMQFVMRRELWLREGGWTIRIAQAADGLLFQEIVKRYGIRYIVGPLAEHL